MIIRWGIIGLGNIAHRFAQDLVHEVDNGVLHAVASRNKEKSRAFAAYFNCEIPYHRYQDLLDDPAIDVVYVATIHPEHISVVEQCLTAGKHVLVEKPAFTSEQDWIAMKHLAHSKGLLLIEAMKSVTFPAYRELADYLVKHKISLRKIEANFGNVVKFDANSRLFDPQLGGGATLDVAVYPLWLFYDLCRITRVPLPQLTSQLYNRYPQASVDDHATFISTSLPETRLQGSLSEDLPREAHIYGDDIHITIAEKWWNPTHILIEHHGKRVEITHPLRGAGMCYEIEHVQALLEKGQIESDWICANISQTVIASAEHAIHNYLSR